MLAEGCSPNDGVACDADVDDEPVEMPMRLATSWNAFHRAVYAPVNSSPPVVLPRRPTLPPPPPRASTRFRRSCRAAREA